MLLRPMPLPRVPDQLARVAALALGSLLIAAASPQNRKAMTNPTPVVRLAELQIVPSRLDAYLVLLREEIEASVRLEPGVLTLNAVALKGSPNHIRLMEIYADQAAYEAHLKSPHFAKYKSATATMVRSLTLHETTPIALGSKQ